MNFLNKVKSTGLKAKASAEVKLLELEGRNRKKRFGIELYQLLTTDKTKMLGLSSGTLGPEELRAPFESARQAIAGIEAKKDIIQKDLDVLEVKGPGTMPDETVNDKMKQAGRAVTNAGKEAKLKAERALLDREIKIRQEDFGLEAFDVVKSSEEQKEKGIRDKIRSSLNANSKNEQDIQACIDMAKIDLARIEGKIQSKRTEIASLD
jgi:hypothetical protein